MGCPFLAPRGGSIPRKSKRFRWPSAASGIPVATTPVLALVALAFGIALPERRSLDQPASRAPADTVTWAAPKPSDTLKRGMALSHALDARGMGESEIRAITGRLEAYRDPRLLREGTAVRFALGPDGAPYRVRIELNPDSMLDFVHSDTTWAARIQAVPFAVDTVCITGFIESSLWSAQLGGDLDRFAPSEWEGLVYDLADVFAWKVDFTRDLRHGDGLRVALERKMRADGTVRSRHFLAIELRNRDRVYRAFPQDRPGGKYAYYDEEGRSLRGAYLRYPVPYRITSHYGRRRFHPLLKRVRAHQGIDYGAPYGTPVEATASGVVARAGWSGGYGRMVELRHPNGVRTRYAHLSSIPASIRRGARVEQGQIVGKVGSSGLATGPHLHYEFLVQGRHANPLNVEVPSAPSVEPARLAEFQQSRDRAVALLAAVPIPREAPVLAAGPSKSSLPGQTP